MTAGVTAGGSAVGSVEELAGLQARTVGLLAAAVPGGRTVTCAGVVAARSGLPHPLANGFVVVSGDEPDDLAPALASLAGLPYAGQLAADRHPRTRAVLERSGHLLVETSPAMLGPVRPPAAAPVPAALAVRAVGAADDGRLSAARTLSAEVFGVPSAVMAAAYAPAVVASPEVTTWVGAVDDEVVTTAQTYRFGDAGLLANVATAGAHRRSGYGAALSAVATTALLESGCRRVWLVSSRAGSGIYQSLGFRTVGAWQTWLARR